ncbi:hypothetical protein Taro_003107 [Colocasia esculenta]|uniref:Uncharacterized protein n=1 Tax=Colocasia esculenta TaxID=4460 RepID=A0A843TMS1_COLES|nr:hypothetical protein [Colocasia esculenta]
MAQSHASQDPYKYLTRSPPPAAPPPPPHSSDGRHNRATAARHAERERESCYGGWVVEGRERRTSTGILGGSPPPPTLHPPVLQRWCVGGASAPALHQLNRRRRRVYSFMFELPATATAQELSRKAYAGAPPDLRSRLILDEDE